MGYLQAQRGSDIFLQRVLKIKKKLKRLHETSVFNLPYFFQTGSHTKTVPGYLGTKQTGNDQIGTKQSRNKTNSQRNQLDTNPSRFEDT